MHDCAKFFQKIFCQSKVKVYIIMDDHDVQHMLEQLNLTQYASALQEGGYDDLESMISVSR